MELAQQRSDGRFRIEERRSKEGGQLRLIIGDSTRGTHELQYLARDEELMVLVAWVYGGTTEDWHEWVAISDLSRGRVESQAKEFVDWYLQRTAD